MTQCSNERFTSDHVFQMKDVKRLRSFSYLTTETDECFGRANDLCNMKHSAIEHRYQYELTTYDNKIYNKVLIVKLLDQLDLCVLDLSI